MTAKQMENACKKLAALEAEKKELEKAIESIKADMQSEMQDAETYDAGKYLVSWTRYTSSRFDQKAFKADHPKIFEKYALPVTSRRFSYKLK